MNQIDYVPALQAMVQLRTLSADEESRLLAEQRELALITERMELAAAEARGEARGEARARLESLQYLIESGIPEERAKAILHTTEADLPNSPPPQAHPL